MNDFQDFQFVAAKTSYKQSVWLSDESGLWLCDVLFLGRGFNLTLTSYDFNQNVFVFNVQQFNRRNILRIAWFSKCGVWWNMIHPEKNMFI